MRSWRESMRGHRSSLSPKMNWCCGLVRPPCGELYLVMIWAPADGRPAFRVGAWDRDGREHNEDGVDDHNSPKNRLGVCAGERVGTVSEWRSPGRAGAIFSARFEMYRESVLSAPQ